MSSVLNVFNAGRIPAQRILHRSVGGCYGIIHFSLNTFTDKEWGYGDEDPQCFNPTDFNAEQIVQACKDGGLTGLILVCKHHDGFCLWPTKTTDYNITHSPFRGGKGDLVREIADACHKLGMAMGFYVSPWDRHDATYGTPEYLDIYRQQLREIYTQYGPAFEAWFDGANGGDGYYGGAREPRVIDRTTYYDWKNTWQIIRDAQPQAVIFSDIGPDVRWVGNERGLANPEAFASITPQPPEGETDAAPGCVLIPPLETGQPEGNFFLPPECDVPLRPGWFYHQNQNARPLKELVTIYLRSVGCGGFLNLGIAPDRRGQLHENDVQRLRDFKEAIDTINATPILSQTCCLAIGEPCVIPLARHEAVNLIELSEDLTKGESVTGYQIDYHDATGWHSLLHGQAIGLRRIKTFSATRMDALRLCIQNAHTPQVRLTLACRLAHLPELSQKQPKTLNQLILSQGKLEGLAVTYDLPAPVMAHGFIFTPETTCPAGTPDKFAFQQKLGGSWETIVQGEFSNIRANPIPQEVAFPPQSIQHCRLVATHTLGSSDTLAMAQFALLLDDSIPES